MQQRIICVLNHKGGVGKTTTTLNLGKALNLLGKKVLLIDIDPQANLSQCVGVEEPEHHVYEAICENADLPLHAIGPGFFLAPSDLSLSRAELRLQSEVTGSFKLRNALRKLQEPFDYILIDCPPSLGILTVNALMAAGEVLLVVQSQYLAIKGLQTILDLMEELKQDLNPQLSVAGLVVTQTNRTVFSKSIEETLRGVYGGKVFQTAIRQNVALAEASASGSDIFEYNPKSSGAEDYQSLANELVHG